MDDKEFVLAAKHSVRELHDDVERFIELTTKGYQPHAVDLLEVLEKLLVVVEKETSAADVARIDVPFLRKT